MLPQFDYNVITILTITIITVVMIIKIFEVTANNSISLAQFDYAVKFEEEYREAIASGGLTTFSQFSQVRVAF